MPSDKQPPQVPAQLQKLLDYVHKAAIEPKTFPNAEWYPTGVDYRARVVGDDRTKVFLLVTVGIRRLRVDLIGIGKVRFIIRDSADLDKHGQALQTALQTAYNRAEEYLHGKDDDVEEEQDAQEEAIALTFGIERDLQSALCGDIKQLEEGLKITGIEKPVASGRIDITAQDENGVAVVIELKKGEAGHHAIGQILAYMGDLADQSGAAVRGILVARDFTPKAIAAARIVPPPRLQLRKYNFRFAFEIVGAG
jgi:hypothetical protein